MSNPPRARQMSLVGCPACGLVCRHTASAGQPRACPRCHAPLYSRRPASITRSWAMLIAAMIFYLPANMLPVMHSSLFGKGGENTIMTGVTEFWRSGSYGIALLIFVASVVIPCFKFFALSLLLLTSRRHSTRAMPGRTTLYRLTELIGYWSMLDVMVVAAVSASVKFQRLSDVEPRSGILFFGLVVFLTMLAAMNYDPRLIWDGDEQ